MPRSNDARSVSPGLVPRAISAFYTFAAIHAALAAVADISVTARLDSAVRKSIATIPAAAWTPIKYTHAIYDEDTRTWISDAEVAEIPEIAYTAFTSRKKSDHILSRLIVRHIPELNKNKLAGQATLFDLHRFHAFFTTSTLDPVWPIKPTAPTRPSIIWIDS